jgi:plasmid stabilization system protein ParE
MEIVWTERAIEDLSTVYRYRKRPTAIRHVEKILAEVNRLSSFPEAAPVHKTLHTNREFRALAVVKGLYKVFYSLDLPAEKVIVLRVWDCRQNTERLRLM